MIAPKSRIRLLSFLTFVPAVLFILFQFVEEAGRLRRRGNSVGQLLSRDLQPIFFNALFNESLLIAVGAFIVHSYAGALR